MKLSRLRAVILICTLGFAAGCAVWDVLRPAIPALVEVLLEELDSSLYAYEETAYAVVSGAEDIGSSENLQDARRQLILQIIDCLVEDYPEISVTSQLERLNDATALEPDG